MKGQSFINFLREQEGKADRQKVLALSALVGSSVLAQLMFAGVASAVHCNYQMTCDWNGISVCMEKSCDAVCPNLGFPGSCVG